MPYLYSTTVKTGTTAPTSTFTQEILAGAVDGVVISGVGRYLKTQFTRQPSGVINREVIANASGVPTSTFTQEILAGAVDGVDITSFGTRRYITLTNDYTIVSNIKSISSALLAQISKLNLIPMASVKTAIGVNNV